MQMITTIGLDIAKSVFQVYGVDAGGQVIVRRQLKRRYVQTFFQKLSPSVRDQRWNREGFKYSARNPAQEEFPKL
jgi:transposase